MRKEGEGSDEEGVGVRQVKEKGEASPPTRSHAVTSSHSLSFLQNLPRDLLQTLSLSNLRSMARITQKSFMILFVAKSTWSMGVFYLMIGLFFAMLAEATRGPKYNSILLLALLASFAFPKFPKNSVRPQLVLTLVTTLSLALDLQCLLRSPKLISPACKAFVTFSILAKFLALYDLLWFSDGSLRARKYLIRSD